MVVRKLPVLANCYCSIEPKQTRCYESEAAQYAGAVKLSHQAELNSLYLTPVNMKLNEKKLKVADVSLFFVGE